MDWSRKNNIKWTSKYKTGWRKKKSLIFFDTEICFPSLAVCDTEKIHPKVCLYIEDCESVQGEIPFNASIMVCVKKNLYHKKWEEMIDKAMKIETSKHLIYGKKFWGKKVFGGKGYNDCLLSTSVFHIVDIKSKTLKLKDDKSMDWKIMS